MKKRKEKKTKFSSQNEETREISHTALGCPAAASASSSSPPQGSLTGGKRAFKSATGGLLAGRARVDA